MFKGKKILAVIPARGGSKGIHKKNIIKINGKNLLEHTFNCLNKIDKIIDKKIISSDSHEIIKYGRKFKFEIPFVRPQRLSGDRVDVKKVLLHAVKFLEQKEKSFFDIILCIEPTCPLRKSSDIMAAIKKIIMEKKDSVWSISETDSKYHPQKQLILKKKNLDFYSNKGKKIIARQQLSKTYYRNGAVYAISRDFLINKNKIIGKNTGYIISKNYMTSIDTMFDVKYSEWIQKNFK